MKKYFKIHNSKFVIPARTTVQSGRRNLNAGMTYVELIVVLSIFATMSSIAIYNYGTFQDKIDTKNLSSNIALKVVEAQKSSTSGVLPSVALQGSFTNPTLALWKPAYGVYFDTNTNTNFVYFIDIDQNGLLTGSASTCTGECLQKFTLTKGATISGLNVFYTGDPAAYPISDLNVVFTRPNSGPIFKSGGVSLPINVSYVQVTVRSPKLFSVNIKIYPSGRIQVN